MGNVLLVEDNAPFRNWAKFVIERHGLVVVAARTAAEALQQAADKTIAIEVLVTDIYLPPTNGWELSKKVLDLWPALRVLFMSAHALDDLRGQDMEIPENRFLRKPFQAEILLQKIDLLIDGRD